MEPPSLRLGALPSDVPDWFWTACTLGSAAILLAAFFTDTIAWVLPLLSAALLLGLLALERNRPADREGAWTDDPQRANDIGHLALGSVGGEALGNVVIVAGAVALSLALPWQAPWPHAAPIGLQLILLLAIADFLEYWRHRAEHEIPALWRIHALHHETDRLHALKSSRNHPLDMISRYIVVYVPLALLGVPATWMPVYAGAIVIFGPMAHANLKLHVPRWCHRVVTTPQIHALHHAKSRHFSDANYSPVTPLWDQLFGTYRHPDSCPGRPAFGVEGEGGSDTFLGQLVDPFRFSSEPAREDRERSAMASEPSEDIGV